MKLNKINRDKLVEMLRHVPDNKFHMGYPRLNQEGCGCIVAHARKNHLLSSAVDDEEQLRRFLNINSTKSLNIYVGNFSKEWEEIPLKDRKGRSARLAAIKFLEELK